MIIITHIPIQGLVFELARTARLAWSAKVGEKVWWLWLA